MVNSEKISEKNQEKASDNKTSHKDSNKKQHRQENLINYYEVLGVEKNASSKEIRNKYRELVKKYHPIKNPDKDPKLFELIQRAWECLGNEEKRKQYDMFYTNVEKTKKGDFVSLKEGYSKYMELSKSEIASKPKEVAEKEFDELFMEMDKKSKFDRKKAKEPAISSEDAKKKYGDLQLQREQEELEYIPQRIFKDGQVFDHEVFNEIFDMQKEKSEGQMIKHSDGPGAFNDGVDSNFTTLDSFDNTYGDGEVVPVSSKFASLDNFGKDVNLEIDPDKLKSIKKAGYTKGHNKIDANSREEMERKLKEREAENKQLSKENMTFDKFETDPKKSYMFTHEVGAIGQLTFENNDDDDLIKACNKLIALEKEQNNQS